MSIPALILPDLAAHMAEYVGDERTASVFLGELGGRLRRSNIRRATHWRATVQKVGLLADFHDLRHTGNQLTAEAATTTKELMGGWATAPCVPRCVTSTRPTVETARSPPR